MSPPARTTAGLGNTRTAAGGIRGAEASRSHAARTIPESSPMAHGTFRQSFIRALLVMMRRLPTIAITIVALIVVARTSLGAPPPTETEESSG